MAVIFALSSISRPPDLPSAIGDKGGHALLYSGLASLLVRGLAGGWRQPFGARTGFAAVAYSTIYGATDEVHQMFVPFRTADLADLAADALGASAAVLGLYAAHALRARFGRSFPIGNRKL
jgi:VanZ family protein